MDRVPGTLQDPATTLMAPDGNFGGTWLDRFFCNVEFQAESSQGLQIPLACHPGPAIFFKILKKTQKKMYFLCCRKCAPGVHLLLARIIRIRRPTDGNLFFSKNFRQKVAKF